MTLGNLLDRTMAFEQRLESYYAETRSRTGDDGVRLLTHYLSEHGRHLSRATETMPQRLVDEACALELPEDADIDHESEFRAITTPPLEVSAAELVESAINYAAALEAVYRRILEGSPAPPASDVLGSLVAQEVHVVTTLRNIESMNYF